VFYEVGCRAGTLFESYYDGNGKIGGANTPHPIREQTCQSDGRQSFITTENFLPKP
jgi:hypothetical protein